MQCFGYLILLTHGSQATFLWHFAKLLSTHLQYHISMTKWSYPRMSAAMATISNPAQVIHQNYVKSFQRLHKKFPKILHVNKQKNVKKNGKAANANENQCKTAQILVQPPRHQSHHPRCMRSCLRTPRHTTPHAHEAVMFLGRPQRSHPCPDPPHTPTDNNYNFPLPKCNVIPCPLGLFIFSLRLPSADLHF